MLVTTNALTKRYGSSMALEACSLHVSQGEIFGLLGHNGAGKTTLLRLLLGYITPSSGMACVDGINCATQSLAVRSRTAYLPGEARLFRRMKGHATEVKSNQIVTTKFACFFNRQTPRWTITNLTRIP